MNGYFSNKGELFFDIDLIATDGLVITIDAMLDTGFTDWLAMDIQDIKSFGWPFIKEQKKQTAGGEAKFELYAGIVLLDGIHKTIQVIGGEEITHVLMGLQWLETRRLVVDKKMSLLTLGVD
jgi:predicted aspartyl protease